MEDVSEEKASGLIEYLKVNTSVDIKKKKVLNRYMNDFSELAEFLSNYNIRARKNKPTFLKIARFTRRENVWSNILCFYLDKNHHGMEGFLLECIGNCIGIELGKVVSVKREVRTGKRNRIDIFVETDKYCFYIENKVDARLYNPLDDYLGHTINKADKKNYFGIVLGFNLEKKQKENIYCIEYSKLLENININKIEIYNKYVAFFIDFIKNIKNVMEEKMASEDFYKVFLKNEDKIKDIQRQYKKLIDFRKKEVKFLKKTLEETHSKHFTKKPDIQGNHTIKLSIQKQNKEAITIDIVCY